MSTPPFSLPSNIPLPGSLSSVYSLLVDILGCRPSLLLAMFFGDDIYETAGKQVIWTRQYFGHLMRRADSSEKTLMLGGIGGRRRRDDRGRDGWMASLTWWTWVWVNSGSWWWTGRPGVLQFMGSQRVGYDWATDLIWSDLMDHSLICVKYVV